MLWRSELRDHIGFSDLEFLEDQVRQYRRHLKLITAFLQSVREGNFFDPLPFVMDYYLRIRMD